MIFSWLLAGLLLLGVPGSGGEPVGTLLVADGPLLLEDDPGTLPPGCTFESGTNGAKLLCPVRVDVALTLSLPGYEARRVEFVAGEEVDLRDARWIPTAVPIHLEPGALVAGTLVAWVEDGVLRLEPADGTVVFGPRVEPGTRLDLAVVGPHTVPVAVSMARDPAREPLVVQLEPGRSSVVVCNDPWTGGIAVECTVEVGTVTGLMNRLGGTHLLRLGKTVELGALHLVEMVADSGDDEVLWLRASTPDGSAALVEFSAEQPFHEVDLDAPSTLGVVVREKRDERPLEDVSIRVARSLEDAQLVVAEALTDSDGVVEVALPPGNYWIDVDGAGYNPVHREVDLGSRKRDLVILLEPAVVIEGVVVDSGGLPVADAVVAALEPGFEFRSRHNFAMTDTLGRFELTLPGSGPWNLMAQKEGYLADPLEIGPGTDWVTLTLRSRCEVVIHPLRDDGSPVPTGRLVLLRQGVPEVVAAEGPAVDGGYRAVLAPGNWTVIMEGDGLRGLLGVPEPCEGFVATPRLFGLEEPPRER